MNNPGHLPDVEIHTDIQRLTGLLFFPAVIQLTVKLMVNRPAGKVGELATEISLDQLRRV